MALTTSPVNPVVIGSIGTNPNQRPFTTQGFKDEFDQFGVEFTAWFNTVHIPEVEAMTANTNRLRKLMGIVY